MGGWGCGDLRFLFFTLGHAGRMCALCDCTRGRRHTTPRRQPAACITAAMHCIPCVAVARPARTQAQRWAEPQWPWPEFRPKHRQTAYDPVRLCAMHAHAL